MRWLSVVLFLSCASAAPQQEALAPPTSPSKMERLVERYATDREAIQRFYEIGVSPTRLERLDRFERSWLARLADLDFDALERAEKVDYVALRLRIEHVLKLRANLEERLGDLEELLPFAAGIVELEEARWKVEPVEPREAAQKLGALAELVEETKKRVEKAEDVEPFEVSAGDALWVAGRLRGVRSALAEWYRHYDAYAPGFAWWCEKPHKELNDALEAYGKHLREEVAGQKGEDDDPLVGDPIGREALLDDLARELIPYTPEELLAIGEEQLAWCETEMRRASADLGFGDDWKAALEHVKGLHVPPGEQDALVAAQAREAIAFLDERDLVTIPELCRETWRVRMLSRQSQRTLPYAAYGGQRMDVAYPTVDMDLDQKLMAMRGNNIHFTRAVTPHELIPGHHLQGFMARRYNTHRSLFRTPFYGEGWALYWEMVEWDLGWPKGPEDRIGMLFWRMHRAARIIVSLKFHLERMETEEMIDFLVDRVGHERDGATSEVRRYVGGGYGPLYQCAYMIGGLQLRALHAEVVGTGKMTDREYHDAVLQQNSLPIELIRAALTDAPLTRDHEASWKFAGEIEAK